MDMSKLKLFSFILLLLSSIPLSAQENTIPKTLKTFVEETLVPFGNRAPIFDAIIAQNTTVDLTLQKIQDTDKEWTAFQGMSKFMLDLLSNACALELWNLQVKYPYVAESFVTDKQGALVAMTRKIDRYWQGDQDYFMQTYQKGTIYYGKLEEDKNGDDVTLPISIPIKKADEILGVMHIKVDLDHWENR